MSNPITAAIIDSMTAPAPAHTITVTWTNGTRATYSANMLDLLRTDPAAIDIQDDTTGELVYIKPDPEDITTDEKKEEGKPMFENLRNAVNAHYNQQAAEFAAKLETITAAEALKTWYYTDRMTPAALEMVKAAATADQDATIPEAARAKILKRYNNENEKNRARYLEKLDRAEAAEPLNSATIVVDWTRSRTWGWNPTATVTCNSDYNRQTKDSASGCGYDKESAAICGAFNANPSIMRALYEHAEQGRKFPYSVNTYAGIPYFDGGCGVSCNYSVFKAMGYKFTDIAHSRTGADVYSITRA